MSQRPRRSVLPPLRFRDSSTTDAVNDVEPNTVIEPEEVSLEQGSEPVGELVIDANGPNSNEATVLQDTLSVPENSIVDNAVWGALKGKELVESVSKAYSVVVLWRRNLFYLPTCKAGEDFIEELAKLYQHFNNGTPFTSIALSLSAIIFPLF